MGGLHMKYCRECGFQLNDEDKFCPKCGKPSEAVAAAPGAPAAPTVNMQMPQAQPNPAFSFPDLPHPGPNEAMLVVMCNSTNPKGNVLIKNGTGQNVVIKNGEKSAMSVAPGNMVIHYTIDRGPGLTLVAARKTDYKKMLIFHPGETIIMQVGIGREINHAVFQSSLGFVIS